MERPPSGCPAAAATQHYTDRFKALLDEAAQGMGDATVKVGDAAAKLQEWLRRVPS